MKATLLILGFLCFIAATQLNGADRQSIESEIEEAALSYRLKFISTISGFEKQEFCFVRADPYVEEQILKKFRYKWLKKSSSVMSDGKGRHKLKSGEKLFGTCIGVHDIEKTEKGWRCIISHHSGPLGAYSLRYYLEQIAGQWMVIQVVDDPTLPIS